MSQMILQVVIICCKSQRVAQLSSETLYFLRKKIVFLYLVISHFLSNVIRICLCLPFFNKVYHFIICIKAQMSCNIFAVRV